MCLVWFQCVAWLAPWTSHPPIKVMHYQDNPMCRALDCRDFSLFADFGGQGLQVQFASAVDAALATVQQDIIARWIEN